MKRVAALLLLAFLVTMVPTGCGKKGNPAEPSKEDAREAQAKGPAPAGKAVGQSDVTLLYWGSDG